MQPFSLQVRYFEQVALHKSVRRAAERLHVSPSAVTRQIALFEEQLGAPLFERLPRGVRLTAAGEMMLAQIQRMQRDFGAALTQVDALKGMRRGRVGMGVLQYMNTHFVPELIVDVTRDHPGLAYTIHTGNSPEIIDRILKGEIDIGLCWAPPASTPVRIVRVYPVPIGVVVAADHELAARKSMRLAECLTYPLILQSQDMALRRTLDDAARGTGRRVAPFVESNSIATIVALLVVRAGISIMTRVTVQHELATGTLAHIPISDRGVSTMPLALMVRAERPLTPAASLLLELLEHRFNAYAGQPSVASR